MKSIDALIAAPDARKDPEALLKLEQHNSSLRIIFQSSFHTLWASGMSRGDSDGLGTSREVRPSTPALEACEARRLLRHRDHEREKLLDDTKVHVALISELRSSIYSLG